MRTIELICASSDAAECGALREALADRAPKADITVLTDGTSLRPKTKKALQVELQVLRREPDFMVAQLIWSSGGGAAITGPKVEVSTMDRNLTTKAPIDLARGLLKVSDLPI